LPALPAAAHPFVTDDAKTQNEISSFNSVLSSRAPPAMRRRLRFSAPQLSYGLVDSVDRSFAPIHKCFPRAPTHNGIGFGDVFAGVKWRFFEDGNRASALGAGRLPHGQRGAGLDAGQATSWPHHHHCGRRNRSVDGAIRNVDLPSGGRGSRTYRPHSGNRDRLQVGIDMIADQTRRSPRSPVLPIGFILRPPYLDWIAAFSDG
jgi:hypothetical protein